MNFYELVLFIFIVMVRSIYHFIIDSCKHIDTIMLNVFICNFVILILYRRALVEWLQGSSLLINIGVNKDAHFIILIREVF